MGNYLSKELACEKCQEYKRRIEEYELRIEEYERPIEEVLAVVEKLHLEYVNSIAQEIVSKVSIK